MHDRTQVLCILHVSVPIPTYTSSPGCKWCFRIECLEVCVLQMVFSNLCLDNCVGGKSCLESLVSSWTIEKHLCYKKTALGNVSETPTPTTSLKSTAVHLQFVRQYAPHLYRRIFLASKLRRKGDPAIRLPFVLQYASHLYGSTPPICTAILLEKYWGLGSPQRFWSIAKEPSRSGIGSCSGASSGMGRVVDQISTPHEHGWELWCKNHQVVSWHGRARAAEAKALLLLHPEGQTRFRPMQQGEIRSVYTELLCVKTWPLTIVCGSLYLLSLVSSWLREMSGQSKRKICVKKTSLSRNHQDQELAVAQGLAQGWEGWSTKYQQPDARPHQIPAEVWQGQKNPWWVNPQVGPTIGLMCVCVQVSPETLEIEAAWHASLSQLFGCILWSQFTYGWWMW